MARILSSSDAEEQRAQEHGADDDGHGTGVEPLLSGPGHARHRRAVAGAAAVALAAAGVVGVVAYTAWRSLPGVKSNIDEVTDLHIDTGAIAWHGYPGHSDCFGVDPGGRLQVMRCAPGNDKQRFFFSRKQGLIVWRPSSPLCVRASSQAAGAPIVLGPCLRGAALEWLLPQEPGPVRLVTDPSLCILGPQVVEGGPIPDLHSFLGDCGGDAASAPLWADFQMLPEETLGQLQQNSAWGLACLRTSTTPAPGSPIITDWCQEASGYTEFVFPGRYGPIMWGPRKELCVDAGPAPAVGTPVVLSQCNPAAAGMIWESPFKTGPLRLQSYPGLCLEPQGQGGQVLLAQCSYSGDSSAPEDDKPYDKALQLAPGQAWNVFDKPATNGGFISLYCAAVFVPNSWEHQLFSTLLVAGEKVQRHIGIFACDDFDLFARERVSVGRHPRKGDVWATPFKQAPTHRDPEGASANVMLFMYFWVAVYHVGAWQNHDWIIKSDPDAVFFPERVKDHVKWRNAGDPQFIENCGYWHGDNYPAMWGALEVISLPAMKRFFPNMRQCLNWIPWGDIGEDRFIRNCLLRLGVSGNFDTNIVGDQYCHSFGGCGQKWKAAYHPFKNVDSWLRCWQESAR